MSYHSFPDRHVVTRKFTTCYYCEDPIPIGSKVLKQSGVQAGEGFFNGHVCAICEAFINSQLYKYKDHDWDGEGIAEGSFLYSDKYLDFRKEFKQ